MSRQTAIAPHFDVVPSCSMGADVRFHARVYSDGTLQVTIRTGAGSFVLYPTIAGARALAGAFADFAATAEEVAAAVADIKRRDDIAQ